jgi:nucleotide-binding universal stress UspA family protein
VTDTRTGAGSGGLIVVGVDGSAGSAMALGYAVSEARLRQAKLDVVLAWQIPATWDGSLVPVGFDPEATGRKCLQDAVSAVPSEDIVIRQKVVQGHPATVLLTAAAEAELLVVGSRGHGGFVGSLLGSVSHRCVAHATCPVVVVPAHCYDKHMVDV